ncbi:HNH endonuclease signature motif containing protein [Speluncibacter jeojiensis]|uniref:HNH endonuclease n=1 Tax=Speluncibacter jeojiensis TaxID=2710754 RepID=A0A9X4RDU1_9ACTN|nr:HNH endonuclease [Corynebacteriales bacterium D3-21]
MHSKSSDSRQVDAHLAALDAAIEGLLGDRLGGLSTDEIVEVLQRTETALRKLTAADQQVVTESSERSLHSAHDIRTAAEFLVKTLRISEGEAQLRLRSARHIGVWHTLQGDEQPPEYPHTAAALHDGAIGLAHVEAIRDIMRQIPSHIDTIHREAAEQILALLARHADPKYVTRAGLDLLAYLNPDGVFSDRDRKRQRSLHIGRQRADLMTPISGLLDPETRALLEPLLAKMARPGMNNTDDPESPIITGSDPGNPDPDRTALAHAAARDTRTVGQRNHDAVKAGLRLLAGSGALGNHRGLPATVIITMTLQQLEEATGVATTAGGGLLPIRDALGMAEHAHPVLALFDHNGRPLHLGRTRRLASADQRLALIAASRGCTRPGCDAPASMAAVHHVTDWAKGGRTDIDELDLACDSCHALIHDGPGGWRTDTAPPGSPHPGRTRWTPPAHIDPDRAPQVNIRHHLDELFGLLLGFIAARRADERQRWQDRWDAGFDGQRLRRTQNRKATADDEAP